MGLLKKPVDGQRPLASDFCPLLRAAKGLCLTEFTRGSLQKQADPTTNIGGYGKGKTSEGHNRQPVGY